VNRSDEDVLRFAAASFPSIWALELLLAVKQEQRAWEREELIANLRASELVVSRAIDGLVAAGLVTVEDKGVAYLPVNAEVAETVERLERLYRTRPNSVRRAIIASGSGAATAFADAFRLRKDADD
jgi:hypothetical protein